MRGATSASHHLTRCIVLTCRPQPPPSARRRVSHPRAGPCNRPTSLLHRRAPTPRGHSCPASGACSDSPAAESGATAALASCCPSLYFACLSDQTRPCPFAWKNASTPRTPARCTTYNVGSRRRHLAAPDTHHNRFSTPARSCLCCPFLSSSQNTYGAAMLPPFCLFHLPRPSCTAIDVAPTLDPRDCCWRCHCALRLTQRTLTTALPPGATASVHNS